MIDVSVVICVRDEEHRIVRQLKALDAQIDHPSFEVVVVDNGSTDGTAEVVRAWIRDEAHAATTCRIVDAATARGIPAVRNVGTAAAVGRVIAFCDADDEVRPQWVGAMARAVRPGTMVGGRTIARTVAGEPRPDVFGDGLIGTGYLPHASGCNMALERADLLRIGGCDESLPRYGFEDVELSWRAQEAGLQLQYAPDAVVDFSLSESAASVRKRFRLGQGRVLMARRYPRYDAQPHTLADELRSVGGEGRRAVVSTLRARSVDRSAASRTIAAAGRVVGALRYPARKGAPAPQLPLGPRGADHLAAPVLAIATNNGDLGGGEIMLLRIARALRELGIEVLVVGPRAPGDLVAAARAEGFAVTELRATTRRSYLTALLRWRLTHRDLPLWCNGLLPALATAGIGPRIVHLHRLPSSAGQRRAARIAARGAARVLVPSEFLARQVPGTRVLPNWTDDLPLTGPRPGTDGPVRIGFLGRVTAEKGVDVLARALEILRDQDRDLQLVVAGEARFAETGDAGAAALTRLGDEIDVLGWTTPQELFAQVDVAAFPSVAPESFGMVAAEAMAAGVPFVVSDAGALREVAGPDHPFVARAGDAEDLARVLALALDTPDGERAAQVAAARARWEDRFTPAAGREHVSALLTELGAPFPAPAKETP